ncbi:Ig-like domain-containing protein [Kitasatospora sp. NPDC052896]|uniref:Ig-like domain-containing protein n=1 Tax=Kitasatospora sp. NPDC052896 TaxID=3364061 RepID=UPI0037CABA8F
MPVVTSPEAGSVQSEQVLFQGTAASGGGVDRVEVAEDGTVLRTLGVNMLGQWGWASGGALIPFSAGTHTVYVTAVTWTGERSVAAPVTFTVTGQ